MSKVISTDKLKISMQVKDGICYLSFSGDIDEDFVYDEIVGDLYSKYLIDFYEVQMINSCGIREWISFLERLGEKTQVIYVNCPQVVIQQMNMVEGFLTENSFVYSFYAPYYCEELDLEKKVLLKSSDIVGFKAPELKHEGHELEFDAHEKQYFHFLSVHKKAS